MHVDKFGSTGDESITTIQPLRNYAINLGDLENVEGFNREGKKDVLYGYQLDDCGIYVRTEIKPHTGGLDNNNIEDRLLSFVSRGGNWIPVPLKYEWHIDIRLNPEKISTRGTDHTILKIYNSGRIIGSLVPVATTDENIDQPVLTRAKGYFISSSDKKQAHLEFNVEFKEDKSHVNEPSQDSTIIIEGRIIAESEQPKEILPNLLIHFKPKYVPRPITLPPTPPFDFKIIVIRDTSKDYGIRFVTPGLEISNPADKPIEMSPLKIHDFYQFKRLRLTTQPVSDDEILYL